MAVCRVLICSAVNSATSSEGVITPTESEYLLERRGNQFLLCRTKRVELRDKGNSIIKQKWKLSSRRLVLYVVFCVDVCFGFDLFLPRIAMHGAVFTMAIDFYSFICDVVKTA